MTTKKNIMRIVGGSHRGKKLASPSGLTIRPTSERTREALFNILIHQKYGNFVLKDAKVLDLFAGTGAIGLEALSRGAKELTAVEINQVALNCLHQNISSLGFSSQTNIIEANAVTLRPANDQDSKHSLIFLDPPYSLDVASETIANILNGRWLNPHAIAVVELKKNYIFNPPERFEIIDKRVYGASQIIFLQGP